MKIVMVAGGTGGHIYPALSLAEELEKNNHEITFIGSNDRMEKDLIPTKGYKYIGLDVFSTRGNIFNKVRSLLSILKTYKQCLTILKGYDMAIGFGNYISIPVMSAACKLKLKTIIHEQNSFVGRANRFLDKKVDLIIGSYEENLKQFKNKNIKVLGNPQSSKAYYLKKDPSYISSLGLKANKKTVIIFMGSLGSSSVNEKLIEYFSKLDGSYQVVYATGKAHYENTIAKIKPNDYLKIFEHIDGISAMKNADLLLCRGGATTLSEIKAIGIPAIIIPSPYVPNNHQYYNGKALVDKNAAIMVEEKNLTASYLNDLVEELLNNDSKLESLRNNSLKLGNPNVMSDIIEEVENL